MALFKNLLYPATFLAVFMLAVAGPIEEAKKELQKELEVFQKCGKEGNISEEILEGVLKNYILPDTRAVKCFASCHLRGMKLISEDAIVDWDQVDEMHKAEYIKPEEEAKSLEVTKLCRQSVKNGGELCDTAYNALKCFLDNSKKLNLRMLGPEDV